MENINFYKVIDSIDADALMMSVFNTTDIEKVKLPKEMEISLEAGGKEYAVTTKLSAKLKRRIREYDFGILYDLADALDKMKTAEEILKEKRENYTGGRMEIYAEDTFVLDSVTNLTEEQFDARVKIFVALIGKLFNEDALHAIAEIAPKKKDGGFAKNKFERVVAMSTPYLGEFVLEVRAKPVSDTLLEVVIAEERVEKTERKFLETDFVNTFINELGLTEFISGADCDKSKTFDKYFEKSFFTAKKETSDEQAPEYDSKQFEIVNNVLLKGKGNHEEAIIPEGVVEIGKNAFKGKKLLKKVVIPESCKKIGEGAFSKCESLAELEIGNGVETIASGAFGLCTGLDKIILGENVKKIAPLAFPIPKGKQSVFAIKSDVLKNVDTSFFANAFSHYWLFGMKGTPIDILYIHYFNPDAVFHIQKGSDYEKLLGINADNWNDYNINEIIVYFIGMGHFFDHPIKYEIIPDDFNFASLKSVQLN